MSLPIGCENLEYIGMPGTFLNPSLPERPPIGSLRTEP